MLKTKILVAAAVSASIFTASISAHENPITLKLAHTYPGDHYFWEHGGKLFIDSVTARTNGRIQFEIYPAGQLGKDNLSLLKYGVADMAILIPSAQSDKFPLSTVSELPGMFSSSCEGAEKWAAASGDGRILDQLELEPNGIEPLFFFMVPQLTVFTSKRKVSSLTDLSGLKLRANGAAVGETFRALGASPIQLGSSDLYNSVTRGTVDGAYFSYIPLTNYSLENQFRYSLDGLNLGSSGGVISISNQAWNKLPSEVKEIMREEAPIAQEHLCSWMEQEQERMRSLMANEHNMDITYASEELRSAVEEKVDAIKTQWARRMEAAGLRGTDVITAFSTKVD